MYNSETLYEAILANIESKYILSEDTLSMISQSNWLDNKIIQIAYDDDKNQFINDKDLHKELKSTLDILKAVKLPILKLTLKSSIRFIEDEFYFLIYDILNMSKRLKIKIEINATSYNGLNRYHNELVQKLRSRKAKTNKNPFKLKDKWINTHNLLQKSKLKIKHLNSVYLLDKESADMQHCVQIYDEQVKSGKSYIFHIDYYKKPYTCELVFRKNNIVINQLYGKYNQEPDPKLRQKIDKLLETLNSR